MSLPIQQLKVPGGTFVIVYVPDSALPPGTSDPNFDNAEMDPFTGAPLAPPPAGNPPGVPDPGEVDPNPTPGAFPDGLDPTQIPH